MLSNDNRRSLSTVIQYTFKKIFSNERRPDPFHRAVRPDDEHPIGLRSQVVSNVRRARAGVNDHSAIFVASKHLLYRATDRGKREDSSRSEEHTSELQSQF